MIIVTVEELQRAFDTDDYSDCLDDNFRVYHFTDADDFLLYIGRSRDAVDRAIQHIDPAHHFWRMTTFNMDLRKMRPASLKWKVRLYTLDDLREYVKSRVGYYGPHWDSDAIVDVAEREMIYHQMPYYNITHNNNDADRPPIPKWLRKMKEQEFVDVCAAFDLVDYGWG